MAGSSEKHPRKGPDQANRTSRVLSGTDTSLASFAYMAAAVRTAPPCQRRSDGELLPGS